MTAVTLDRVWINRTDTGDAISAQSGQDRTQSFAMDLSVRTYANGRRRAVTTVGEAGEIPYTLAMVSLATVTQLRSWVGAHVQVRDARGQKWFGVFAGVEVAEWPEYQIYRATITLQTVTTVEGV